MEAIRHITTPSTNHLEITLPDNFVNEKLEVIILLLDKSAQKENTENEDIEWRNLSANNFLKGYSDDEPEYTEADITDPNQEYIA